MVSASAGIVGSGCATFARVPPPPREEAIMWIRLRQIAFVANELKPVIDALSDVLGVEPCFVDPAVKVFGLENTLLTVGNQFIEVVAPIEENTAGGRYLERRNGDGGYMTIMQCDDHVARKARAAELGIRFVFDRETPGEYKFLQLHPRDTGGTFLEIDEQLGDRAHELDGPWDPAGPDWQRVKKTDVVSGISAAEIQSDDPAPLAQRWADILDAALESDAHGHQIIRLDNALLRFVTATDGRGEGLGAIDVIAVDRDRVIAAARQRGCLTGDDEVTIGGVRINLVDAKTGAGAPA